MKVKSSVVLRAAISLIESGEQSFMCAAIQDVETQMRWDSKENVSSKALNIFKKYQPPGLDPETANITGWWPKGSPDRLVAANKALQDSLKGNY